MNYLLNKIRKKLNDNECNMKKLGIIVDGSICFDEKQLKEYDLKRVVFKIMNTKTNEEFDDDKIQRQYIKESIEKGETFKTSCTPPGDVLDLLDSMVKEYESIIIFPMAQGISSQANNMRMFAEEHPGKVFVAKARMMNAGIEYCVKLARKLEKEGKSGQEIVDIIDSQSDSLATIFTCQS